VDHGSDEENRMNGFKIGGENEIQRLKHSATKASSGKPTPLAVGSTVEERVCPEGD
jgi:hypothetical protein